MKLPAVPYAVKWPRGVLRVCRAYGRDPFTWWDALLPGQQALLLADQQWLEAEERAAAKAAE